MKIKVKDLRRTIREALVTEVGIDKLKGMKGTLGSTHEMNVAKLVGSEEKFFVKFSDIAEDLWNEGDPDPSMQCMSEYLAYKLYALYPGVKIPSRIELVYDPNNSRVGIATAAVKGKMALGRIKPQALAKQLEAGVYVDIFLANYDVIGTGAGNLISSDDGSVTRIDPGSSFKYRARGGRKGPGFNDKAGELNTMLDPDFGYGEAAGSVYQYADLKVAAKEFMTVSWPAIAARIDEVQGSVAAELEENGMDDLLQQWHAEVNDIKKVLAGRYKVVTMHAQKVLAADKKTR
jgi:hypothetical protein